MTKIDFLILKGINQSRSRANPPAIISRRETRSGVQGWIQWFGWRVKKILLPNCCVTHTHTHARAGTNCFSHFQYYGPGNHGRTAEYALQKIQVYIYISSSQAFLVVCSWRGEHKRVLASCTGVGLADIGRHTEMFRLFFSTGSKKGRRFVAFTEHSLQERRGSQCRPIALFGAHKREANMDGRTKCEFALKLYFLCGTAKAAMPPAGTNELKHWRTASERVQAIHWLSWARNFV